MDLAAFLVDAAKKERKNRDPNFPVKFESNDATLVCDLLIKKTRWQGRCQVLHCSACPRRFLTPSCGCLSLCHADDNEQVLPTHCISPVTSRFTTERFLLCASGGEERLGGLRGRKRGYGSFRKEINNKPPAAHPQTAWFILRLINRLLTGRMNEEATLWQGD